MVRCIGIMAKYIKFLLNLVKISSLKGNRLEILWEVPDNEGVHEIEMSLYYILEDTKYGTYTWEYVEWKLNVECHILKPLVRLLEKILNLIGLIHIETLGEKIICEITLYRIRDRAWPCRKVIM